MIKDPTGQIDTLRLGILNNENNFFEFSIELIGFLKGHIYLSGISKLNINKVQPVYNFYDRSINYSERTYTELDHLFLTFDEINEVVNLHGHQCISNKSLKEISRELLLRLQ